MARTTYTHYIALLQWVSTGHVDGIVRADPLRLEWANPMRRAPFPAAKAAESEEGCPPLNPAGKWTRGMGFPAGSGLPESQPDPSRTTHL